MFLVKMTVDGVVVEKTVCPVEKGVFDESATEVLCKEDVARREGPVDIPRVGCYNKRIEKVGK